MVLASLEEKPRVAHDGNVDVGRQGASSKLPRGMLDKAPR